MTEGHMLAAEAAARAFGALHRPGADRCQV